MGLQEWGAENLPYIYLGSLFTTLIYSFSFGELNRRIQLRTFFAVISIFLIGTNLVFYPVIQIPEYKKYASLFYFWFTSIFSIASITLFWSIFNLFSTKEEIKRYIGFIAASGTVGAVASSFLIPGLVQLIPVHFILLIAVACFLIAQILLGGIIFSGRKKLDGLGLEVDSDKKKSEKLFLSLSNPIIKITFIIIFCMTFTTTFLDFRFQKMIEPVLKSQNEKTIFFSDVFLYANGLTFLVEFVFLRFILNYFALRTVLLVLPFLLFLFFPMLFFSFKLPEILVTWSIFIGIEYSINKSGREVLYNSLQNSEKVARRNLPDLVGFRLGSSICSIFLLTVMTFFNAEITILAMIPICILLILYWLITIWRFNYNMEAGSTKITADL